MKYYYYYHFHFIDEEIWSKYVSQAQKNTACMCAKSIQSCPTLWDPMDCNLPGSSVHGIFQARILELVAISSSRGSSQPKDQTRISYVSCIDRRVLYH